MKRVKVMFEFDVKDEQALRDYFKTKFLPAEDADDCAVGYFGMCNVEDGFSSTPGVKLDLGSVKWDEWDR